MKEERWEVWFGCGIEGLICGLSLGCLCDVIVICLRNLYWEDLFYLMVDFSWLVVYYFCIVDGDVWVYVLILRRILIKDI